MVITLILIALIVLCILLLRRCYNFDAFAFISLIVLLSYLLFHLIGWGLAPYEFQQFKVKRDSFVSTLEAARTNDNQYEVAAITREVSQWNEKLALMKYQNTLFLLDDYIDDRVEKLEPIK